MTFDDRLNGSSFKTKGVGERLSRAVPTKQTGTGPEYATGKRIQYAYDQSTLLNVFLSTFYEENANYEPFTLAVHKSLTISADRKQYTTQLNLEDGAHYEQLPSGYYSTINNNQFHVIFELASFEEWAIADLLALNNEPSVLVSFGGLPSINMPTPILSDHVFMYNGKYYLAVPRRYFMSLDKMRTSVTVTLKFGIEQYVSSQLTEYVYVKTPVVDGGTGGSGGTTELGDFDYAVVRYIWTASAGRDLDTRTRITTPARNTDVGWSRSDQDGSFLRWGGDNTQDGVESVLIDVKALIDSYPTYEEFVIALKAFWYSTVYTGVVGLEFASYKGGTMSKVGYNYVNNGGALVQTISASNTTKLQQSNDIDGQQLATVYFNPVTKRGRFTLEDISDPETPSTNPVAFNNFSMSPLNDDTVRVTFTNPQANYDLSQHWIVYRSDTPFQSAPAQSQVWDNKSGIINGVNTYDVTGTPGSTYYLAFALASTGNTGAVPVNPIAYVTVTIPAVASNYPAQKVGVTLRLSEDGTAINATVTNPSSASYNYFRAWTKVGAPTMTSLDQATNSWQTSNSNASWDVTNVFTNIEEGVPYSLALALVTAQDTQTPVSEPTYVAFTKWGSLSYNIPKFSLTPVNTRMFSTTFDVDRISAPRGGWFDTSGNLWVYGIESAGYRGGLLQYILSTPFDVGTVTHVNRYVFDMKIGAFNNILSVNFINNGRICIVTANSTSGSGEKYVIARVCNTPYDIMSSADNPNIECGDLKTALATFEYPPLTINPETNKLACITGNNTLKQIDLSYEEGVSTKLGVSAINSTLLSSITSHNIWYSSIPVSGVQISSDGLTILITQSRWGQSDNNARIMQFSTTVPFEFGTGTTLVEYSLDPFGNGQTDLYLGLNSPAYHPRSAFSGNNALLLISQNPIKIIQRGYTLV